jgi:hypothetical protein
MENNITWRIYKGVLMPFNAPHVTIEINSIEIKKLLKENHVWLIKWITNWDQKEESSYYYVIKDKYDGLMEYSSNTRNQIKKGLNHCYVKKVSNEYIINNGYPTYCKAYSRYNQSPPNLDVFKSIYKDTNNLSEYFGVFDKESNLLIGFAENQVKDGACIYGSMRFDPSFLKNYSSYALIHIMNDYYLKECGLRYVSDGAKSLVHDTNIQQMLIQKFNFRKAFCKLNLYYRVPLNIVVLVLFPLRNIIRKIEISQIQHLKTLLRLEEIYRNYE